MPTARERARTEMTRAILDEARRQLAADGAAGLSLRSVARAVGMVSSAVYRYVPSRDDLLTRLIVEAYDALGARAEAARDVADPPATQWRAVWRAVRAWAHEQPAEFSLIHGSPVPGYVAPPDTVAPAARVGAVLAAIVVDAGASAPDPGRTVRAALVPDLLPGLDAATAPAAVTAWTQLVGTVAFELFGQYENVVVDRDVYFDHVADTAARSVGLSP
jgi:AcrR family transcriptional regulator